MFTLLHSERPKLYTILASLCATGLDSCAKNNSAPVQVHVSILFKVKLNQGQTYQDQTQSHQWFCKVN